jgi:hypothetical protein
LFGSRKETIPKLLDELKPLALTEAIKAEC